MPCIETALNPLLSKLPETNKVTCQHKRIHCRIRNEVIGRGIAERK